MSRFLRDYLYIPLGGNRLGTFRTYQNLMATFLLGGLWHGAGWTFVFWGVLHGIGTVIHRLWSGFNIKMPRWLAWFITFNFVNVAWVFFRAKTWSDAIKVLKGMAGMNGVMLSQGVAEKLAFLKQFGVSFGTLFFKYIHHNIWLGVLALVVVTVVARNSNEMTRQFRPSRWSLSFVVAIMIYTLLTMDKVSEFLYFNF